MGSETEKDFAKETTEMTEEWKGKTLTTANNYSYLGIKHGQNRLAKEKRYIQLL